MKRPRPLFLRSPRSPREHASPEPESDRRSVRPPEESAATWEHFPHGADVGVRGRGSTKEEAFVGAALALSAVVADPAGVCALDEVDFLCEAPDDEQLLVTWLNTLVSEMAVRRMLFARFAVTLETGRLHGRAWGEPLDVERHQPAVEIKGATCTALCVRPTADYGWLAQCVVDV